MPKQARVGVLVLIGALIFFGALFLLGQRSHLFSDTFFVRSQFFNVAGLQAGANVQLQGVNVGRVESIELPTRPGGKIMVLMAVDDKAARQIRRNTRAQIQADGLVGNQIVVLIPDLTPGAAVPEGAVIDGVEPFSLAAVTDQFLASAQQLNAVAETAGLIVGDVRSGEGSVGRLLYDPGLYNALNRTASETEALMATLNQQAAMLGQQTGAVAASAERVTAGLQSTVSDLNARLTGTQGTVGAFLNDRAVYDRLTASADSLAMLTTNLRAVTRNTEEMTAWGALGAFRFAELMEAGKHNFLFKGYFERRGYQEQAPVEIRERAIRASLQTIEEQQRALYAREQELRRREAAAGLRPASDTARAAGINPQPRPNN